MAANLQGEVKVSGLQHRVGRLHRSGSPVLDRFSAIHLLTPQVEAALREWLVILGESPMRLDSDSGGFEAIGMGKVLHTESFRTKIDPTLQLHLRALYTDSKGLNLRNRIAHGQASPEVLGRGTANWVIHFLIAIRTYARIDR